MAICFKDIKKLHGSHKNQSLNKISEWFLGAAIGQRYIEGVGNKQETDARAMRKWIADNSGDASKPRWLADVKLSTNMQTASPSGAIGKLVKCLINKQKPVDPLEETKVGYHHGAHESPEEHHIWQPNSVWNM